MAKVKRKAGKKTVRKHTAARRPAPKQAPSAPIDVAGKVALIKKGGDSVPVQLKDQAHLEKLKSEHGEASVEVQP